MINRLRILLTIMIAAITLSGCVQYDLGIEFQDQTHGQMTQHIQLSQQFSELSAEAVTQWTESLEQRVKSLGGTTEYLSAENLQITIPFYGGPDLEQKFNQFFNPGELNAETARQVLEEEVPQLSSQLNLTQQNLIFVLRNRFNLDLDLRALALEVTDDKIVLNSNGIVDLDFSLMTPWGANIIEGSQPLTVVSKQEGKQLIWQLQAGQINHIEAIFWVPSFVGIGTGIILILILLGSLIRYRLFPLKSAVN